MSNSKNEKQHGNRFSRKKPIVDLDTSNPVIANFQKYANELVEKQDRYERIIKQSRDITIESKRIIFLLHTIDPSKNNKDRVLQEAHNRLNALFHSHFHSIANELTGIDPYQFTRAYSPGMQEFIEAYTYAEYLSNKPISDWEALQQCLTYEKLSKKIEKVQIEENTAEESVMELDEPEEKQITNCLLQPMDYMLGLSDLSGEIMRRCVNSLGSGDLEACYDACKILQCLYKGYISLSLNRNREMSQKTYTLNQNVLKAENVCYNIKVRGGEAAKCGNIDDCKNQNIDEGFVNY